MPAREALMYTDLAPWYHLLSAPAEYGEEAEHLLAVVERAGEGPTETLLELGAGGGTLASHLTDRFRCTLTDLSPQMLAESRQLNPGVEHIEADMRTLRLERLFDVVLVHDAIDYMLSERDLESALASVAAHLRPGGLALIVPDAVAETFAPGTRTGGTDGDERGIRYLEWTHDVAPGATSYAVDYVFVLREGDAPARVEHERHVIGLFPIATWERLLSRCGLDRLELPVEDPFAAEHVTLLARRRVDDTLASSAPSSV